MGILYDPAKSVWYNDNQQYMFNTDIREYDIHSAGLSLIKEYQLLDQATIDKLDGLPKMDLNVAIGKLQRDDKSLSKRLSDAFADIRRIFIEANQIDINDIICVKKDAFFIKGLQNKTKFGNVKFVVKNQYSSYIRFDDNSKIEIFFNDGNLDIKGIGEAGIARHKLYLLDFISKMMAKIELKESSAKRTLINFIDDYKAMKLDDGYYLEFNNKSANVDPYFNLIKVLIPLVQIVSKEVP